MTSHAVCAVLLGLCALGVGFGEESRPPAGTEGERLFALKVRPLLVEKCWACHGSDREAIEGELDLTGRTELLKGGQSGRAMVPGDANASLLYTAVTWHSEDLQMPPKENDRLTEAQTWWIRDWINAGAPWPDEATLRAIEREAAEADRHKIAVATSGGLSDDWTNRRYEVENLWAYRPLAKPEIPATSAGEAAHAIDAFLQRRLDALGLSPAPRADRRTLIRRASFDLLGLPPSPEEVRAFLDDPASDREAFAKLVERLLNSPHYGEQWGLHWLDVVRYADTSGFSNDFDRPNAWRYRDYVIRAFNTDKPYDQFVREQLAGDEIDPDDPEKLIATGFLRMGPWEQTGMSVAKITRQQFLDDVTDIVGQVFLSHPLQCARCHDHKFDPIPTRDYYRIQAVFATTQFAERDAPFLPSENTQGFDEQKYVQERLAEARAQLERLREKEEQAARAWYTERGLEYAPRNVLLKRGVPEEKVAPRHIGLTPEDFGLERIARKNVTRFTWELDRYRPIAFSVYSGKTRLMRNVSSRIEMPAATDSEGVAERTAILTGGNPFAPADAVSPGVLSAPASFSGPHARHVSGVPESIRGRRLAFADWVASPSNPLTARSLVNRVWLYHFGRGIAGNPNNFGAMGEHPTHPELLDWLAVRFIEDGWSIKQMHRIIMSSDAYCRSSVHPNEAALAEQDPLGTSYARFAPRRLTAEELRDAMLFASGELSLEIGGVPVRPEINLEAALQPRQTMGTYAPAYQPSPLPSQRNRRSIYAQRIRGLRDPFMEVFNQPASDMSCEAREASTVTPQVFSLFNGEETADRALAWAKRLFEETTSEAQAVELAFWEALGRRPRDEELRACLTHLAEMTVRHRAMTFTPNAPPREVVRHAVEEMSGERFSFTERLNVYDDYIADLKPWDVDARTRALAEVCLVLFNANEFAYVY